MTKFMLRALENNYNIGRFFGYKEGKHRKGHMNLSNKKAQNYLRSRRRERIINLHKTLYFSNK